MVVSMFLSGNTKFFVIEILPEHLMTCDTVLLMEVVCDEPKKPLKISLPNAGKYHTQHGKTRHGQKIEISKSPTKNKK